MQRIKQFAKTFLIEWRRDNVPRLAAALAYFALFSIAPLLLLGVTFLTLLFGEEAGREQFMEAIENFVGPHTAAAIEEMMTETVRAGGAAAATSIGAAVLLVGASSVFHQVFEALNAIFHTRAYEPGGFIRFVTGRSIAIVFVLGGGLLILATLVVGAGLATMASAGDQYVPAEIPVWRVLDMAVSGAIVWLVFGISYRFVPTERPAPFGVWGGAAVAAVLFIAVKYLFGLYLGVVNPGTAYGAAGSIVVILLWVYVVAMIFLIGAVAAKTINFERGQDSDSLKVSL